MEHTNHFAKLNLLDLKIVYHEYKRYERNPINYDGILKHYLSLYQNTIAPNMGVLAMSVDLLRAIADKITEDDE